MNEASSIKNITRKAGFTLSILVFYMLGCFIPVPMVRITSQAYELMNNAALGMVSMMSGANLMRISLFSVGLNPLMMAMIIVQLLTLLRLFYFDTLSNQQVLFVQQSLTLILAIVQSIVVTVGLHLTSNPLTTTAAVLILTAGSMLVTWLGTVNMKYGIGGTLVIILFNIISSSLPIIQKSVMNLRRVTNGSEMLLALVIGSFIFAIFWIAFNHAYYPVKMINTSMSSKTKPIILPIGLNIGGMMTYMMGMSLLMMPIIIGQRMRGSIFSDPQFNAIIDGIMAFLLFYFFAFVQLNPREQAKQMRSRGNYILGIRPGKPTQRYLTKKLIFISLAGAILNAIQITLGLLGASLFGKYAGFAVIPMNVIMVVMFMLSISDQTKVLFFPGKYEKIMKEENREWTI